MVATRRKDDQADATGQPDQGTPVSSQGSDPNAVDGLLRSGRAAEPVGRAPTRSRIAHWHGGRAGRSVKYGGSGRPDGQLAAKSSPDP